MVIYRVLMHILAVLQALFVAFTALAGAFADGGSIGERVVVIFVHPLAAAGLVVLVLGPRLPFAAVRIILALLVVNVIADIVLAFLIAGGSVKGDWELALAFAVIPAIGVLYAVTRLRSPSV